VEVVQGAGQGSHGRSGVRVVEGASGGKKRRWGTSVGDWMNHRGVTEDGTGNRRRVG